MSELRRCKVCHIGTCQPKQATYAYEVDGTLVLLPNTRTYVCDVCGQVEYELGPIARLELLLGVNSAGVSSRRLASESGPVDDLTSLILSRRRSV